IVNGYPVAKKDIVADGSQQEVSFEVPLEYSSWVAMRIFPSSHTNPVFVEIDGKPIRASKRSAQWCIDAVAQCWESKSPKIRQTERDAAKTAFDDATKHYEMILKEAVAE